PKTKRCLKKISTGRKAAQRRRVFGPSRERTDRLPALQNRGHVLPWLTRPDPDRGVGWPDRWESWKVWKPRSRSNRVERSVAVRDWSLTAILRPCREWPAPRLTHQARLKLHPPRRPWPRVARWRRWWRLLRPLRPQSPHLDLWKTRPP